LKEKFVLKKAMLRELPAEIIARVKQPYMAPDSNSFVQPDSPDYVNELLSETALQRTGLFNPVYVAKLREKCARLSHAHLSFKDNMSFLGILSTQLLAHLYIDDFRVAECPDRSSFKVWRDCSSGAARPDTMTPTGD
jgi:asparagine synthase (glutamine-hydrolysing)